MTEMKIFTLSGGGRVAIRPNDIVSIFEREGRVHFSCVMNAFKNEFSVTEDWDTVISILGEAI